MQRFEIRLPPKPQARHRDGKHGGKYDPTAAYKAQIATIVSLQRPKLIEAGPIKVRLSFHMKRPQKLTSGYAYHVKRPDIDNLTKCVLDALNGILWKDDSQVAVLEACKSYVTEPMTVITVTPLTLTEMEDE